MTDNNKCNNARHRTKCQTSFSANYGA